MRVSLSSPHFSALPAQQVSLAGRVQVSNPHFAATTEQPSQALQEALVIVKATKGLEHFYEHDQFHFVETSAKKSFIKRIFLLVRTVFKMIKGFFTAYGPKSKAYQLLITKRYETPEKAEEAFKNYGKKMSRRAGLEDLTMTDKVVSYKRTSKYSERKDFFFQESGSNKTYQGFIISSKK